MSKSDLNDLVLARVVRRRLKEVALVCRIGNEEQFLLKAIRACALLEKLRKDGAAITAHVKGDKAEFIMSDGKKVDFYTYVLGRKRQAL